MKHRLAICTREIFDGARRHRSAALLVDDGRVAAIVALADIPAHYERVDAPGDLLCPGFVDWQVNGGGGVLFNADPTPEAAGRIAAAHARYGSTAILPTVITDAAAVTDAASDAVVDALARGLPGVAGIHFEGPHLSLEKRGVHEPSFIRPMSSADRARYMRPGMGSVVATVAPENATAADIAALAASGVCVSLGHTAASYAASRAAFDAGARAVTHLFNAMSPLHHREPGLVAAALDTPGVHVGLIADGHHLHEAVLRLATIAFAPERLTLVTDAMSSVGSTHDTFELNGRTVRRENGRLTVADGTLAGSDLDMLSAVRFMVAAVGVDLDTALRMASRYPAEMLRLEDRGHLRPGARADMLTLDAGLSLRAVWIGGEAVDLS